MKIEAHELLKKGILNGTVILLSNKAYKIIGYEYETQEYNLIAVDKAS
ncbi:MAG: hypothetical protein N2484_03140 [Clostridia bacterium]|nr:hypothetical protein [Clostridia bacterium]